MFPQRVGLDLFAPLTQTREDLKQLFHDQCPHRTSFLDASTTCNRILISRHFREASPL